MCENRTKEIRAGQSPGLEDAPFSESRQGQGRGGEEEGEGGKKKARRERIAWLFFFDGPQPAGSVGRVLTATTRTRKRSRPVLEAWEYAPVGS